MGGKSDSSIFREREGEKKKSTFWGAKQFVFPIASMYVDEVNEVLLLRLGGCSRSSIRNQWYITFSPMFSASNSKKNGFEHM